MKVVSKITFGVPEEITPVKFKEKAKIELSGHISALADCIKFTVPKSGCKKFEKE